MTHKVVLGWDVLNSIYGLYTCTGSLTLEISSQEDGVEPVHVLQLPSHDVVAGRPPSRPKNPKVDMIIV